MSKKSILSFLCFSFLLLLCSCNSFNSRKTLFLEQEASRVTLRSSRMEVVVENATFISCRDLVSGKQFALPGNDAGMFPKGLGSINDNYEELRRLHVPWGAVELKQHLSAEKLNIYLYPDEESIFEVEKTGSFWKLSWKDLTNGEKRFPDCSVTMLIGLDENGALIWKSKGYAPHGGLFGINTPLANISTDARFIYPHFGGMEFKHHSGNTLSPFGEAPFWEAPVIAIELENTALGLWIENEKFAPYYAYHKNGPKGLAFSYELNSLMPFEDKTEFETEFQKMDIFQGDWKSAMKPFKDWYEKKFAQEISQRDSIPWAEKIRLVIDNGANYEKVAETFPPETVMYHNWNGRAPAFDTELPDWTPRKGYIENVKQIQSYGFKTMAYVNTYCINYQSPVFKKDKLEEVFLTRKNSLWRYKSTEKLDSEHISEMQIGTVNVTTDDNQFAGIAEGKLLYGDPLSAAWRKYHADSMKVWNSSTGTDANYEDTAGCVGDHGNGIVDGLSAGQGSVEQMRLLQKTQPQVPMASEYGPDGIAFAVKWPLNYAQVWGNVAFRKQRLHRQVPVNSFLYGYITWIPIINCGDDFHRHLVAACSDALGGMGMLSGNFSSAESGGLSAHLTHRAKLYTSKMLKPYFNEQPFDKNIRCLYEGIDGIYKYYDDGNLQKMLAPDGKELYGRIDGTDKYLGELQLPGWPLYNDKAVFGLNPNICYALFPKTALNTTKLQIKELPKGLSLTKYYEGEDFAYLELNSNDDATVAKAFELISNGNFNSLYINDEKVKFSKVFNCTGKLPLRILACKEADAAEFDKEIGSDETYVWNIGQNGLFEGIPTKLKDLPHRRRLAGVPAYFVNYFQEKQMDWLITVPDKDAALKILFKNYSNRYGNGSIVKIRINGRLIEAFDCVTMSSEDRKAKRIYNTALQERILPLGEFAGKSLLVTIAVDDKADTNSDNQSVAIPIMIRDKEQKWQKREIE